MILVLDSIVDRPIKLIALVGASPFVHVVDGAAPAVYDDVFVVDVGLGRAQDDAHFQMVALSADLAAAHPLVERAVRVQLPLGVAVATQQRFETLRLAIISGPQADLHRVRTLADQDG